MPFGISRLPLEGPTKTRHSGWDR